jgi:hypothetical protein
MTSNFNAFDLETYGSDFIEPYCLCIIFRKKRVVFYGLNCVSLGLKWLFDFCPDSSIFYAHNLSFDGNIVLNFIPKVYEIDSDKTFLMRGDFYSLCLRKSSKIILFKCSAKILPLRLEEIAVFFNIGSKKFIDHTFANKDSI